ncbi:hypothetical protein D3C78_1617390 [compost metagenome]
MRIGHAEVQPDAAGVMDLAVHAWHQAADVQLIVMTDQRRVMPACGVFAVDVITKLFGQGDEAFIAGHVLDH